MAVIIYGGGLSFTETDNGVANYIIISIIMVMYVLGEQTET
jgi:hypothetical protein